MSGLYGRMCRGVAGAMGRVVASASAAPGVAAVASAVAATMLPRRLGRRGGWTSPRRVLIPTCRATGTTPPRSSRTRPSWAASLLNTAVLIDSGAFEYPKGEFGGLKLTPKAVELAKQWDPLDDMKLSNACKPPSIIYAMQGPFPMEVFQGTEFILIKLEYFDMMRIVFMDGRKADANTPDSKLGYSTGRWEGDTLVVETTHLEPSTITNNGLGHGNKGAPAGALPPERGRRDAAVHSGVRGSGDAAEPGCALHRLEEEGGRARVPVRMRPDVRAQYQQQIKAK